MLDTNQIPKLKHRIQILCIINLLIHLSVLLMSINSPSIALSTKITFLAILIIPIMCIYGCRKEHLCILLSGAVCGLLVASGYIIGLLMGIFFLLALYSQEVKVKIYLSIITIIFVSICVLQVVIAQYSYKFKKLINQRNLYQPNATLSEDVVMMPIPGVAQTVEIVGGQPYSLPIGRPMQ